MQACQGLQKLCFAKPIFFWVLQKQAVAPALQGGTRHLLKEEESAGLQDAGDLGDTVLPRRYMVQDAKIEDGVEAAVIKRELLHRAKVKINLTRIFISKPSPRTNQLLGIQVNAGDMYCTELSQKQRKADAAPAAHFQHMPSLNPASKPPQKRYLVKALHDRSCRVVDEPSLRCI